MEHSTAIMEDAGNAIDGKGKEKGSVNALASNGQQDASTSRNDQNTGDRRSNDFNRRKRKGDFGDSRMQHGSRRGGRNDNKRHKKGDMGRGEYLYVPAGIASSSSRH